MTQAALAPTKGTSHELDALFAFGAGASRTPPPPAVEAKPAAPVSSKPGEDFVLCELVARIATSDERALGMLYDATVSRVYSMARSITHNLQCAEAVTEDVYWQVWRQALRFDRQRGPVLAWLLTLARSGGLAHLRRRDETATQPDPHTIVDDADEPPPNPAHLLSTTVRADGLRALLHDDEDRPGVMRA